MSDNLAKIKQIIDDHQSIRGHVKLVSDLVSDQEALWALEETRSSWIPGRPEITTEKQNKLQQTLSFLDEGLKNHFAFEEQALPPLLGDLLMRALILDHQKIKEKIDEAKSIAVDSKLEGLSREELLSKEFYIQQVVVNICQLIEEHAAREEAILGMVERALEEKESRNKS